MHKVVYALKIVKHALTVCMGSQNKSRIDIGRLRRLSSAFGNYTTEGLTASSAASSAAVPAGPGQPGAALDRTTAEALKLVFRREGSYAQVCPLAYRQTCHV